MKYNLPERVIRDISTFAKKHSVEKVILFLSLIHISEPTRH